MAAAAEDEGGGEVSERHFGEHAREEVDYDGGEDAGEPEPLQVGVDASGGEDALGTDQAPDDGGVEEDTAVGTVEFVGLVFGADVCDCAAKCPFEDADLDDAGPEGGDRLGHEHGSGGNFHVLA